MLAQEAPVIAIGAHDPLSARMVESVGFAATYVGSYATSAAAHGLPDVGAVTLTELADHAARVSRSVSIPVLADAEAGFFEAANVWRTVDAFEHAGVCGIHLEDHAGGKHTDMGTSLRSLDDTLTLVQAALEARTDPNFLLIGRTDAVWVSGDLSEAVKRMQAFVEVGVDMVFPTGITPEQLATIRPEIPIPVLALGDLPRTSVAQMADAGADVIVYYGFTLSAATRGISRALSRFRVTGDIRELDEDLEDPAKLETRLGYDAYVQRALRYARRR